MESFNAMHNLVNDIITNLPSAIDKLDMENISGASFKLLDVPDEIGSEKKAMITMFTLVIFSPASVSFRRLRRNTMMKALSSLMTLLMIMSFLMQC
jgi:hypothetical protein